MDTSSTPTAEAGSLSPDEAGKAFAAMLDPVELDDKDSGAEPKDDGLEPTSNEREEREEAEQSESDVDEVVTVLVDGKPIELTKAQIAESHKNGLRQADYTKKTMEIAEQRKTAEQETSKAREERAQYAGNLQKMAAQLEGALQEQQNIDWHALREQDPVEFLKQQHLFNDRQANLQQINAAQSGIQAQVKAEHEQGFKQHLATQREELLAKIPEWKDEAKMKAGTAELKDYLTKNGYTESEIAGVHDHRAVLNVRKAMLYDQMIAKASLAAKKVDKLPQRVERSAGGESKQVDRRAADYQRLAKSGRIEDAARVFAGLID